jgi:hypothetical protein
MDQLVGDQPGQCGRATGITPPGHLAWIDGDHIVGVIVRGSRPRVVWPTDVESGSPRDVGIDY